MNNYRSLCHFFLSLLLIISFAFASGCGKKSAPTLKAYEPPVKIDTLRAVRIEDKVILSWEYSASDRRRLKGFVLTKRTGAAEEHITLPPGSSEYRDSAVVESATYQYSIRAINTKDVFSEDSNIIGTTLCVLPNPPEKIHVKVSWDIIEIGWEQDKPTRGINGCPADVKYNLYRSEDGRSFSMTAINQKPIDVSKFNVLLETEKVVYYTIRPVIEGSITNIGKPSIAVPLRPSDLVPAPPVILNGSSSSGRVFILWQESRETYARGYKVYKRVGEGDFKSIATVYTAVFTEENASDKDVFYRVTALGPVSESVPSETVRITTGMGTP